MEASSRYSKPDSRPLPLPDDHASALADALRRRREDGIDVQAAIREFVRTSRAHGLRPEQVVVALKALVRGVTPRRPEVGSPEEKEAQQLMERSVKWCIDAYFRAD